MNVILVGGGKVGMYLASMLSERGDHVKLVEVQAERLPRLQRGLPADIILLGSGSDPATLEAAGIRQAHVVAAVTGADEVNLVVMGLARFEFNVPRTIARANNPRNAWMFTPEMGVDVVLNQADIMGHLIVEEMSLGDMMTLLKLRRGEYSLVEEKLRPTSRALGIPLKDMGLPLTCVIAAVIRQGKVLIPRGNMTFETGDEILALVDNTSLAALRNYLA